MFIQKFDAKNKVYFDKRRHKLYRMALSVKICLDYIFPRLRIAIVNSLWHHLVAIVILTFLIVKT